MSTGQDVKNSTALSPFNKVSLSASACVCMCVCVGGGGCVCVKGFKRNGGGSLQSKTELLCFYFQLLGGKYIRRDDSLLFEKCSEIL